MSYSTAFWEDEKPEDQKFAHIYVMLEIDPELDERQIFADRSLFTTLALQVRTLADEAFKRRVPAPKSNTPNCHVRSAYHTSAVS